MTFATLKRRHWEVNLEKHERVVPVGDVHGDLRALMGVLDYAGVVAGRRRWTSAPATAIRGEAAR